MMAACYWAAYLKAQGIRQIVGLPGTESLELVEAARQAGLDFILTHHEATAAFIAQMLGQLTGIPGVCLATRGPGAANLVSGVAAAHLDRRPLLAVAGDHPGGDNIPRHQLLPLIDIFRPITRASLRVVASLLPRQLPEVFNAARGDCPGPVFMSFPSAEALKMIEDEQQFFRDSHELEGEPFPDVAPILSMIAHSKRMILIIGLGVLTTGTYKEVIRLAESLQCPVADTPQVKGCFPNDHPLYIGTFGVHGDDDIISFVNQSDLVLTIGLDSVEFLRPWRVTTPVASVAVSGGLDPAIPAETATVGHMKEVLEILIAEARTAGSWPSDAIQRLRKAILNRLLPHGKPCAGTMFPQSVVTELQAVMSPDGIVAVDVGSHKLLMIHQWCARMPHSFLCSSGISSMGTGLAFAIAAKLVFPDRQVAAVIGDGGYLMYLGELATVARLNLPLLVVVMADAALSSIKIKQQRRLYPPVGTEIGPVPAAAIARDFGLRGERVTSVADCRRAMADALGASMPTVIEAVIDPAGYTYSQ